MKPSKSDVLILLGLVLLGTGLFYWFGKGVAMTVAGAVLLFMGIGANWTEKTQKLQRAR